MQLCEQAVTATTAPSSSSPAVSNSPSYSRLSAVRLHLPTPAITDLGLASPVCQVCHPASRLDSSSICWPASLSEAGRMQYYTRDGNYSASEFGSKIFIHSLILFNWTYISLTYKHNFSRKSLDTIYYIFSLNCWLIVIVILYGCSLNFMWGWAKSRSH